MLPSIKPRKVCLSATFVLLSGLVGCAGFDKNLQPTLSAEVTPGTGPAASGDPASKFTVEVRTNSGKAEAIERPLSGQLSVQEALDQTGASKRFKRFFLTLYRPLPKGGWHKMTLSYDRGSRRVPPENDYGMLPGDRIIVTEDPSDVFDDLTSAVLAPLRLNGPQTKRQEVAQKYHVGD